MDREVSALWVQKCHAVSYGMIGPPDVRRGNPHFQVVPEGIAFGLAHIRGVGTAAIEKITKLFAEGPNGSLDASGGAGAQGGQTDAIGCAGSLQTWPQYAKAATELPRNVAEALVKAGACDWSGLPRTQMLSELEAILGTSTRDEFGEKVEIKGLTDREVEYFVGHFDQFGSTAKTLEHMSQVGLDQAPTSLSAMSKPELSELLKKLAPDLVLEKPTVKALKDAIVSLGWTPPKKAVANEERRAIVAQKAKMLDQVFTDSNTANAHAERYFLGIALTCSPADDADASLATATCLDVARSSNDRGMPVVCVIDQVGHTKTKRGKPPGAPMCFLQVSDSTYSFDTVVFSDSYEAANKTQC